MKWLVNIALAAILAFNSLLATAATDAPAISLPGINGEVELSALKGKVVYLDFWASWCLPCVKSFPWMKQLKDSYQAQSFEILAVNLDKDRELADQFLDKMGVNFLVGFDPAGDIATLYKLRGMPSSFLIGRDGKIYATHLGFRNKDKAKIEKAIQQLLTL